MDGVHDMGGMHGFGTVVPDGEALPRGLGAAALRAHAASRGSPASPPPLRAMIESMLARRVPRSLATTSAGSARLERRLELAGSITPGDVAAAIGAPGRRRAARCRDVRAGGAASHGAGARGGVDGRRHRPALPAGDRVRVRRMRPEGHTRCPRYVRGAAGVIERVHGDDHLADVLARGEDAPLEAVYAVRFAPRISSAARGAALSRPRRPLGVAISRSLADARPRPRPRARPRPRPSRAAGLARRSCGRARSRRCWSRRASSRPTRSTPSSTSTRTTSGRRTARGCRARVDRSRVPRAPARRRHRRDRRDRLRRRRGRHMVVVENTPDVHNVIVCTLCSCYPWPVLGLPPSWYKSAAVPRARGRRAAAVLAEFGLELPDDRAARVGLERRGALPRPAGAPGGHGGLSEERAGGARHA